MTMEEEYKRNCELFPSPDRLDKVRKILTRLWGSCHLLYKVNLLFLCSKERVIKKVLLRERKRHTG